MLIAPEPVANDEGGSDDVLTPIKVGSANPTPRPIGGAGSNDARRMPTPVVYLDDRENQGRHTGGHH